MVSVVLKDHLFGDHGTQDGRGFSPAGDRPVQAHQE